MATVSIRTVRRYGNSFAVWLSDGRRILAHPTTGTGWESRGGDIIAGLTINKIQQLGNQYLVRLSNGATVYCVPTMGEIWIAAANSFTDVVTPPEPEIYNPWGNMRTGHLDDWESHASYSAGGDDWGLAYGTDILAPAAGILRSANQGSGEFQTGGSPQVGSAGRRSHLVLDSAFPRIVAKSATLMNGASYEADGPITHIVFQHQSAMGVDGAHFNKGDVIGQSGASADGSDYGGDTHLHVHGLQSSGARVDFIKFVPGAYVP
jgi:hypothetical protein